ncbi:MAG: hypothetical protein ABIQ01_12760, partial [Pseudolysinimonas sp.]
MASESELRDRFHEGTLPSGQIDVDAVLRRARARRRPRIVLAGAGSVLAIAAIAVPAALGSFATPTAETLAGAGADADDSATSPQYSQPGAAEDGGQLALDRAPAERLNLCSAPLADVTPAANGLVLS